MKNIIVTFLTACFLIGCGKEKAAQEPPIQLEVIAPELSKQFERKLGESFLKVGEVEYKTPENTYLVEIHYTHDDQEERFVMPLLRSVDTDDRHHVVYKGIFPLRLIGDKSPAEIVVDFKIDELMNK